MFVYVQYLIWLLYNYVASNLGSHMSFLHIRTSLTHPVLCQSHFIADTLIWIIGYKYPWKHSHNKWHCVFLSGPRNVISACCFSSNGHYLCLSSWDKMLRVYDIALGTFRRNGPIVLPGHEGCVSSCVYSNDGEG